MTIVSERAPSPVGSPTTADPTGGRRFRPDIQGLRAVAVLLVVLYHADVPGFGGGYVGVDVFFVISGFLITGHLVREVTGTGRVRFVRFYLRRARRLLPAAALVAVATLILARVVAPLLEVRSLASDALFVAVYGLNFRLAQQGIEYQDAARSASPLQHYWSLAVEEQFYLVWPLLVMVCVWLGRRRWPVVLPVVLVVVVGASLWHSQHLVTTNGPLAYFSLQSRAWELGVGALVALAAPSLVRLPTRVRVLVSWGGLAVLLLAAVRYSDSTPFPGVLALGPVLATAVVIAGGCGPRAVGAESLLSRRVLQGIGKVSYPWYLWHYPLVLLMPYVFDYDPTWWRNIEMMVLALWLAVLTHWFLENPTLRLPLRRWRWVGGTALMSGVVAVVAAIVTTTLPVLVGSGDAQTAIASATAADPAYVTSVENLVDDSTRITAVPSNLTPDLSIATEDLPETAGTGCLADFLVVDQGDCVYGEPMGAKTVVLFGDSHADQWEPAFAEAARRQGWRLISWTKSACPAAELSVRAERLNRAYTECDDWRKKTLDRITALKPDLVVVSQSDSVTGDAFTDDQYVIGMTTTVDRLSSGGIKTIYLADTVYPANDSPRCVADNLTDATQCGRQGTQTFTTSRREAVAAALARDGVPVVDPTPWQCAEEVCPAIIGNMLVYRDASHLTATYSRWMAPLVEPLLASG